MIKIFKNFWFFIVVLLLATSTFAAIDLKFTFPGTVVGVSDNLDQVAIAYGTNLCLRSAKSIEDSACFQFPSTPKAVAWSDDNKYISIVARNNPHNNDNIWLLNLSTFEKSIIWPSRKRMKVPQTDNVMFHEWLSNNSLIVSQSCGTECLDFSIIEIDGSPIDDHKHWIIEGNLNWIKQLNQFVATGHAGELTTFKIDNLISQNTSPYTLIDGCLKSKNWFRYEATLSPTTWLLSRQPCMNGTSFELGAPLVTYQVANGSSEIIEGGSPASVSPSKRFIASIAITKAHPFIFLLKTEDYSTLLKIPLTNYLVNGYITNYYLSETKPIWSANEKYLLLPLVKKLKGELYIDALIISVEKKKIIPCKICLPRANKYYFMRGAQLLIEAKSSVSVYQLPL